MFGEIFGLVVTCWPYRYIKFNYFRFIRLLFLGLSCLAPLSYLLMKGVVTVSCLSMKKG